VAWHPLGWKAAWLSEIEKFPCAVLAHHYPDVPNLGDMTTLPNRIRSGEVEAPDVFCGGTPCQAFSVAGLRKSLDDARGNLSLTFCEIADAIDQVRLIQQSHPSIVFWENVPGVLNTKDNAFGCFLGALAGEDDALIPPGGRWSNAGFIDGPQRAVAWRVLDAQYFGVAQRRKRVFVVASARDDFDPAAVLFEFKGLRRDFAPSRKARQNFTSSFRGSAPDGGDTVGTLMARDYKGIGNQDLKDGRGLVLEPIALAENTIGRLPHNGGNGDGFTDGGPMYTFNATGVHGVAQPVPFKETADCLTSAYGTKWNGNASATNGSLFVAQPVYEMHGQDSRVRDLGDTCTTVSATYGTGGGNIPVTIQPIAFEPGKMKRLGYGHAEAGLAPTLRADAGDNQLAVAQAIGTDLYNGNITGDVAATMGTPGSSVNASGPTVMQSMAVRRLTPTECERLQGFPDNYTKIADKTPDGPRYKALGNSWAVPVVRWIGERIARAIP